MDSEPIFAIGSDGRRKRAEVAVPLNSKITNPTQLQHYSWDSNAT